MADHFADRLLSAIDHKGSPICVGIDPIPELLPPAILATLSERGGQDPHAVLAAVRTFVGGVLEVVAPLVPCVKFQSAYFEQFRWQGVQAYFELIQKAKMLGLIVIGDVKRGDIGPTASAYAAGHLAGGGAPGGDASVPDAITINPMLGMDTIEPFAKVAADESKGLFVLVRTSNPGSGDLQDAKLADGRTWSEMLAEQLHALATRPEQLGRRGWSSIGAVVGATQTHTMTRLRAVLPQSIFLLPGYGTQGATAEMTRAAFRGNEGAIVSASRSILYAHRDAKYAGRSWQTAVEAATRAMRDDLASL